MSEKRNDMILDARNESININGFDCDYISFGKGKDPLIMLPGVGDGFKTAKGVALPFALMYRCFAESFRVYVFSRRNDMPEGFTTADMADDLDDIMEALGIWPASVFGVSQGGMIAQQMAIRHPDKVSSLVLAVTASRPNDIMRESLETWIGMADRDDYKGIMLDTAERSYTGDYLERARMINWMIAAAKPKDYTRFRILCRSCLDHDVFDDLHKISCPALIIGADQDKVLGTAASEEMQGMIPNSQLYMYEGYSHGVYEQAKDFNSRVLRFLMRQKIGICGNTEEKITVGEGTGYPLNGALTLPHDVSKPVPAVVMVHGSGPSNMDEKVGKLTPFKDLAEGLAAHGIASLRYDKRTYAHAGRIKKLKGGITVKEETIEDAVLAVRLLKDDPRIDPDQIYILGHSMGAMLAPRIDAEGADVKGLIMMAGTPYRLEEIVLRQLKQAGEERSVLKYVVGIENRIFSRKFGNLYSMSDEEAKEKKFAGGIPLYYFKEMGRKTAADYLLENSKPVLIMQGGKDFQVLANEDFASFRQLLAGRSNTFFKLYPELDHAFVYAICDDITKASKEYNVERHIGKEVIKDIADFINRS